MTRPMTPAKRAHSIVARAIERGWLTRQPCEVCGKPNADAHHRFGYERALDIAWLCRLHHFAEHPGAHAGHGETWDLVMRLVASGARQAEIARQLGVSRQRVHAIVHCGPDGRKYRADAINRYYRNRKGASA